MSRWAFKPTYWGEGNETPEECVRREAHEEASVTLGDLHLVGQWTTTKRFHSPHNKKYPNKGYQLLYIADVQKLNEFEAQFEISERAIVPLSEIKNYHHDFDNFSEILEYLRAEKIVASDALG
jgi:8-oxo-dGTP pyrophosphatase MutT (NUDIX family)